MIYQCHDKIVLKNGQTLFAHIDLGDKVECYNTDDWNDVCDSEMYNLPMSYVDVLKEDIVEHVPFEIVWVVGGKTYTQKEYEEKNKKDNKENN